MAETELGPVKFTKPVAYQEIDWKRVEVDVAYQIEKCKAQNTEYVITHPLPLSRGECKSPLLGGDSGVGKSNTDTGHGRTASPSPPTTKQKTSSSTPCWHPRTWAGLIMIWVLLSPSTQAGTCM